MQAFFPSPYTTFEFILLITNERLPAVQFPLSYNVKHSSQPFLTILTFFTR
jgi:hypothetical protein